ncbi:metallophosphoesterase family protein [Amphritea japonica]|uniref:Calcineurin-like phosphoesterase domain-containing protein n=1 Tax=Amphritea japonica ATCC BAA-1530 TaxID=1278309 RepID=A0A7R6P3V4_9GAMM|nr:metallophosphoesterase family protein [Amphritea japonica]BBB25434.1 conserved hypothetical protein [Amphritea japonica ATCC BAA-1530]
MNRIGTNFSPDETRPLLIFGGPYSNLQATEQIQVVASELNIPATNILCTGDLVAYCAQPDETVELIKRWNIAVVAGNCEESVANGSDDCGCGFVEGSSCDLLSAQWYNYTLPRVSSQNKDWMKQLPDEIRFNYGGRSFSAIHGGTDSNNQFLFSSDSQAEKQQQITASRSDIILAGHCGLPFGQNTEHGYWLNAGVIGMPANDASALTWYMLISPTDDHLVCSWHRLSYDHNETAIQMQKAGLNNGYMKALSSGLWPSLDVLPEFEAKQTGKTLTLAEISIPRAADAI